MNRHYSSYGLSDGVVASVVERDPGVLQAAPKRVTTADAPIPYAHVLEDAVLPLQGRIEAAIRRVLA